MLRRFFLSFAVALALGAISAARLCAQQTYSVTDLGTYGSYTQAWSIAVNNYGKATFTGDNGNTGPFHSFYWDGSMLNLLPGPGGSGGWAGAAAINDAGWIVGQTSSTGGNWSAALWRNGVLTNLTGKSRSYASGINNLASPQITGTVAVGKSSQAYLWQAGKYITLPFSSGNAINNLGQIAGADATGPLFWSKSTGVVHLYAGTSPTQGTTANAINDSGLIAGVIETYSGGRFSGQPVVWYGPTGAVAYYLPNMGNAKSINSSGVVVGSRTIWDAVNGTRDLNTLLDSSGAGWLILDATSISDTGYILATAYSSLIGYPGEDHVVLLTPH